MAFFAGRRMLGDANQKEDAAFGCSLRGNLFTPTTAWSVFLFLTACSLQRTAEHRWAVVLFLSSGSLATEGCQRQKISIPRPQTERAGETQKSARSPSLPGDSWATWSWKTCLQSPFRKSHKLSVPRIWGVLFTFGKLWGELRVLSLSRTLGVSCVYNSAKQRNQYLLSHGKKGKWGERHKEPLQAGALKKWAWGEGESSSQGGKPASFTGVT